MWAAGEEYQANALIIATGATAKRMHLPGEENLWQKGISACAVCDGALPFFRNKVWLSSEAGIQRLKKPPS